MNDKLHLFIQAALNNPRHPVYHYAYRSPILQNYAVNVKGGGLLETITPDDWEKQYPEHAATMLEVMRLCEEDQQAVQAEKAEENNQVDALKKQVAELVAQVARLTQPPVVPVPPVPPPETPAE